MNKFRKKLPKILDKYSRQYRHKRKLRIKAESLRDIED